MAKDNKQDEVVFVYGKLFDESLKYAAKQNPAVVDKLKEFVALKFRNPLQSYGSNDKPFTGGGAIAQYLPKARKAHLTHNLSIIYELQGRNPLRIILDGVFNHDELGVGTPPHIKTQKNIARRIANSRP